MRRAEAPGAYGRWAETPAPRAAVDVPNEPIIAGLLLVAAGLIWVSGWNPLFAQGLFIGALLRAFLPTSQYMAATIALAPVLFALDRYNAPFIYEVFGYRQIFGGGAAIYLAFLVTALLSRPRLRFWPVDLSVGVMFLLLALSTTFRDADVQAGAIFLSNTLPLVGAYFAARRIKGDGADLVLDAIVAATACAVLGRWMLEGPGPSSVTSRAGTNWYLGAAVYGALPLLLGWSLTLPSLLRFRPSGGRLRAIGRIVALALLSAELAFLQVKTVFVVIGICAFVFLRLGKNSRSPSTTAAPPLTMQKIAVFVVLVVLGSFAYSILNERISTLYDAFWGNASDRLRLTSMVEHLHIVAERPFGFGLGGLVETAGPQTAQTSHNAFIDIAGDAGIVAAFALAFTFAAGAYVIVRTGRLLETNSAEWWTWTRLALAGTAIGSTILINGSTLYREFPIPSSVLPFAFFGLAIGWCTRKTEAARSQVDEPSDAAP